MAVAENARSRGRSSATTGSLLAAVLMGLAAGGPAQAAGPPANALPTGGQVTAGQAQIGRSGTTLTVNQTSGKAAIDWQTFSIGKDGTVNFVQPSANAVALNRVIGQDPTQIFGALHANGQVFILNPNGVLFAPGAQVSAAGILASTRGMSNADFMAGKLSLSGESPASVDNQGALGAAQGGYVVLVGAQVINSGAIHAPLGDVRLAAADQVTLRIDNGGLAGFTVDKGTLDALAANRGLIKAEGGRIFLTADAIDKLSRAVVNNQGVIEAQTVEQHDGKIVLRGDMQTGSVIAGGTLDASAPAGGDGGFVETSAAHVQVHGLRPVTTAAAHGRPGTWLIDPNDFTIAPSGGDMTGAQVAAALAGGNLTIQSTSGGTSAGSGDIHVADGIAWSESRLTLDAQRNIDFTASLSGSGAAQLALKLGQGAVAAGNGAGYTLADGVKIDLPTGNNFSTQLGSDGTPKTFYVINDLGAQLSNTGTDLQGMRGNLSRNYAVGSNIDASATSGWSGSGLSGLLPVGDNGTAFSGDFEGLGHTIDHLYQNTTIGILGLFGQTAPGSRISNLTLSHLDITGALHYVGGLVGRNYGTIDHVVADGSVVGDLEVGGLVGSNEGSVLHARSSVATSGGTSVGGLIGANTGTVSDSSSSTAVAQTITGIDSVGGLIGSNTGTVSNVHSSATVVASGNNAGGLIGSSYASVSDAYATGSVSAADSAGGLVGYSVAAVTNTYATGDVTSSNRAGGLIGWQQDALVSLSHATGTVQGGAEVGGLAGRVESGGVTTSHASGLVTASGDGAGGLIGLVGTADISDAHADGNVGGTNYVGGLIGRFTSLNDSHVLNVHATGNVTGTGSYVGGLIGSVLAGSISDSDATGTVSGSGSYVGGLIGEAGFGSVTQSWASGSVSGGDLTGGLIGESAMTISSSRATGTVSGVSQVGGLVGHAKVGGVASASHASNSVTASGYFVGGLIGNNEGSVEANSYALGVVTGSNVVGGLVGTNAGSISNAFTGQSGVAGGLVTATDSGAGGLVGANRGSITNASATGPVTAAVHMVGGLVGENYGSIDSTTASGSVSGQNYVGGLVGYNYPGASIVASTASSAVSGASLVGGLVGYNEAGASIDSSTAVGNVTATGNDVGGLVGHNESGAAVTASTAGGNVSGAGNVGGLAGYNAAALTDLTATGNVTATAGNAGGFIGFQDGGELLRVSASGHVAGTGNVGGLVGQLNAGGTVSASSATGNVTATGSNSGGLVGQNIGNISSSSASGTVTGADATGGLVGYNGDVYNTIASITASTASGAVVGANQVGGLVGRSNNSSITASGASGAVSGASYVGGFIGVNVSGGIDGATATGNVQGSADVIGGFAGQIGGDAVITNSHATVGTVSGRNSVGGFIGYMDEGAISTSTSTRAVSGQSQVGGFVGSTGYSDIGFTLTSNAATGAVSGAQDIGGFVGSYGGGSGLSGNPVDGNTGTGAVSGSGSNIGGFAGRSSGSISDVVATNTVTGTGQATNVGGLVGLNGGSLSNSRALNTVTSGGDNVGGAVGRNTSSVETTYAAGNVTGRDAVGGLVGLNDGAISIAYAAGAVLGRNSVGGLIGVQTIDNAVSNAYATGAVHGVDGVGGLIGTAAGIVQRTYATGAVAGTSHVGGFIGTSSALGASDNYYDAATSGQTHSTSDYATTGEVASARNTVQMRRAATFTGWDLSTSGAHNQTWRSYDGLANPLLTYWLTPLTITANGGHTSRVYDGTIHTTAVTPLTYTETLSPGHLLGQAAYSTGKNVGVYTAIGGHYSDQQGYDIGYINNGSLTITPAQLTVTLTGVTKAYDGTTQATLAPGNFFVSGFVAGEGANLSATASYNSKDVRSATSVSATLTAENYAATGDTLLGNYVLASTASGSASITPKAISVSATGVNKVYDGSVAGQASLATAGFVEGDAVGLSGSASFGNKNAGVGKTLTVSGVAVTGVDASNYSVATPTVSTQATITQKLISVAATGVDKVYDGSAAGTALLSGSVVLEGDSIGFTGTAAFGDKNAAAGKTMAVTGIAAVGADAGNYQVINTSAATAASITPKTITVAVTGIGKVYDGSTAATATLGSSGIVAGDDLGFSGTAVFADKNAGAAKSVTVSGIAKSGEDAGNYVLSSTTAVTTAAITPKSISVAAAGVDKVYDGSIAGQASLATGGFVQGDSVGLSGTATYADKNAGAGKALTVRGVAVTGTDAGNYSVESPTIATTATISPKLIGVTAIGVDKVYDGTLAATALLASSGVVSGDSLVFTGAALFADKNAGSDKAVSVSGITRSGADAGNYVLANASAATTAAITPKAITVAATASDKVYDGSTAAQFNLTTGDIVAGDSLGLTGVAAFADKSAGAAKHVTIGDLAATGADAANYRFAAPTVVTTASIAKKAIIVTATGVDRVYDGTLDDAVVLSATGVIAGDSISFAGGGRFADRNAGRAKAVSVGGITATGADAGNYSFDSTAQTTANVSRRDLGVSLTGSVTKLGNGSIEATLSPDNYAVANLAAGDRIGIVQTLGAFDSASAGSGKQVTISLLAGDYSAGAGTLLDNYNLVTGSLSGRIGTILSPSALTAALVSLPNTPSGALQDFSASFGAASGAVGGIDGRQREAHADLLAPAVASAVSTNTRENLLFRRTFSIGDGGIRLPQGVVGSDKDAAQ